MSKRRPSPATTLDNVDHSHQLAKLAEDRTSALRRAAPIVINPAVAGILTTDHKDAAAGRPLDARGQPADEATVVHARREVAGPNPELLFWSVFRANLNQLTASVAIAHDCESVRPQPLWKLSQ